MENLYNILLKELPKIAAVVESFPLEQRDKAMDLLVEALKNNQPTTVVVSETVKEKEVSVPAPVARKTDPPAEAEASKKLSRIRAKIFEKNTGAQAENNDNEAELKASLDKMSTEELSNVVFYQKGRTTPLSDLL